MTEIATAASTPESLAGAVKEEKAGSPLGGAVLTVIHRPLAVAGLIWLAAVALASAFASQLSSQDPLAQDILAALKGPSGKHLLGTDDVGRDILSRLLHGGGLLLFTSLESVLIALVIGVPFGMLAGYLGGMFDSVSSFVVNVVIAIPGFVILVAFVVASGNRLWLVMGVLGVLFSATFFRLVRSSTQSSRELPYVDTARVCGLSPVRILTRHVLPNVTGPLVVQAFLTYGVALIIATGLAFLGLGVSPEQPSWGQEIFVATQNLNTDPWMMAPVGAVLILTILAVNFIGSAIRDALPQAQRQRLLVDPRSRRRPVPVVPVSLDQAEQAGQTTRALYGPDPVGADSASASQAFLQVEGLTVSFPAGGSQGGGGGGSGGGRAGGGDQAVVDRVGFRVRKGGTLGLVGESGCGKTMTALALLGLVPPPGQISAGQILIAGRDVAQLPEHERAGLRGTTIALISQEPMVALDPCFTVGALLRETLRRNRKLNKSEADAEALNLLRLVGINRPEAVARSHPHQISGGMAQRVGIALALTGRPDLLIADEPTTALDVTIQAEILDLLRSLQAEFGMTIVLVTHDLGVVADICTDVAVMYAGEVVEMGSVQDVLEHPAHPYTRGLLGASPELTSPGRPLPTVAGTVPLPRDWPAHCRFADRCPLVVDACRSGPVELTSPRPLRASRCLRSADVLEATK